MQLRNATLHQAVDRKLDARTVSNHEHAFKHHCCLATKPQAHATAYNVIHGADKPDGKVLQQRPAYAFYHVGARLLYPTAATPGISRQVWFAMKLCVYGGDTIPVTFGPYICGVMIVRSLTAGVRARRVKKASGVVKLGLLTARV